MPEVIVLKTYDRLPTNSVTFSRRNIFKRDRFTCQFCGRQPGSEALTIDHVVPRSQGGTSTWENCVLACIDCNARKADRTPEQARMPLRHAPIRPDLEAALRSARNPDQQLVPVHQRSVLERGTGRLRTAVHEASHGQHLHECAPGRAASLQNWRTGFKSSRSCLPTWPNS